MKRSPAAQRGKPILLTLAVTFLTLAATIIAGFITQREVDLKLEESFNHQADQISNTYYSNLYTHVTVLEGLRGFWNTQGTFNRVSFLAYINSLNIDATYKAGVSSFFFIDPVPQTEKASFENRLRREVDNPPPYQSYTIHPSSPLDTLYPVTYVEPIKGRENSLGVDFGTFPDRLAAILYARDYNSLATTHSLIFISNGKPGFFFLLPLYQPGLPLERTRDRRAAFAGIVGAAFRSESAFKQIFGDDDPYPDLDFQIYQGDTITPDRLLHDHDQAFTASSPRFETTRIVRLKGQTWTLKIQSKPSFALIDKEQKLPLVVFASGLMATVFLAVFSSYNLSKLRRVKVL